MSVSYRIDGLHITQQGAGDSVNITTLYAGSVVTELRIEQDNKVIVICDRDCARALAAFITKNVKS